MNTPPDLCPRCAAIVANIKKHIAKTSEQEFERLVENLAVLNEMNRRKEDLADPDMLLHIPTINDLKIDEDEDDEDDPDPDDDSNGTLSDGRAVKTLKRVSPNTPPVNDAYYSGGKVSQFVLSERKPAPVRNALQGADPLPLTGEG